MIYVADDFCWGEGRGTGTRAREGEQERGEEVEGETKGEGEVAVMVIRRERDERGTRKRENGIEGREERKSRQRCRGKRGVGNDENCFFSISSLAVVRCIMSVMKLYVRARGISSTCSNTTLKAMRAIDNDKKKKKTPEGVRRGLKKAGEGVHEMSLTQAHTQAHTHTQRFASPVTQKKTWI